MVVLTLPTGPFRIGAALAVLLTVLAGALARRAPRLPSQPIISWRTPPDFGSWIGAALYLALLATGTWGSRDPLANPLPLTVWTVVWVALILATALLGDLWRPVSPWRAPARAIRRALGRTSTLGLARLGHLPAILGLAAFAWFEIVSLAPADPLVLAQAAALYGAIVLILAVLEGEDWLDRGEFLTLTFALVARIAPLWRTHDGRTTLHAGVPGAQTAGMAPPGPGHFAFVTLLIAGVSFDGVSETFRWLALLGINPLEFPGRSAVLWQNTVGLAATWALVALTIAAALALGGVRPWHPVLFSFLPIAAGYHVAHYLTALLTDGQYVIAALNDPLHSGASLLGLPDHWVSFGFLTDRASVWRIWAAQFLLILGAHLLAVILSFRLLPGGLTRHLGLGLMMVGYTVFGLWLLSAATAG